MTDVDTSPTEPILRGGRYAIISTIARGGMGIVHRAKDTELGREVALKVFPPGVATVDDLRRRREEVRLVAAMQHPQLVTLYDAVADEDGSSFLVLEFVDGPDLKGRIAEGPLDQRELQQVAIDLADALAYVHERGVVHRDIKPANILLPEIDGRTRAKLTDFGIARLMDGSRLTLDGAVLGTAAYLSPEQASGRRITGASDVYSLGLVLLEALTGRRVFGGPGVEAAVERLHRDPEVPESEVGAWAGLLRAMVDRDPSARPTAAQVAAAVRGIGSRQHADDRTKVLPAATTEVITKVAPVRPPLTAEPTRRDRSQDARQLKAELPKRRLLLPVLILVIAVLGIVATIVVIGLRNAGASQPPMPYPSVTGTIGDHLRDLERAVEP